MKVGIVGASGYSGGELLRLLEGHPHFDVRYAAAHSSAGELVASIHPQLTHSSWHGRTFEKVDVEAMNDCEVLFFALPHGESARLISQIEQKVKIIDLGADFRLHSEDSWQKYYGGDHAGTWVYGLPELAGNRVKIQSSRQVANPGCYATAIALGTAPLIEKSLIDESDIVVVAASGTTGAGRTAKASLLASEVMGSLTSYKFGGVHQHTPEIEETLQTISKGQKSVTISFTPVLAPMARGILATITAKLSPHVDQLAVKSAFSVVYANEKFISLLPEGQMPMTSATVGTNYVHIQSAVDSHAGRVVISVALDNLGKGAASQAIQNANLMCGFAEEAGLVQWAAR